MFDFRFELAIAAFELLQPLAVRFGRRVDCLAQVHELHPVDYGRSDALEGELLIGRKGARVMVEHAQRPERLTRRCAQGQAGKCARKNVAAARSGGIRKALVVAQIGGDEYARRSENVAARGGQSGLIVELEPARSRDDEAILIDERDERNRRRAQRGDEVAQVVEARVAVRRHRR
ncbi:MAG: hypothetical protein NVS3B16_26150 [Vulcanimicrobiaceae bacterium]